MAVGFASFRRKTDNTKFVVKNITDKRIKVFTMKLLPGQEYDLMNISFVSEADIKESLLKGELRTSLEFNKIQIVESTISLVQYGSDFISFMESSTDLLTIGIRDKFNEKEVRGLRDLPAPVNGIITLNENNALYYIFGAVNLGNNKILITGANTALIGRNPRTDALVGSNTGILVQSTRGIQIENLSIINSDGYAIYLDGNGTDHIILTLCGLLYSKYAGTISNALVLHAKSLMVKDCEHGLNLLSSEFVSISDFSDTCSSNGVVCFNIPENQSFENILFQNSIIKSSATQTGIYIDPSTTIENKAVFTTNIVYGGGIALGGVTKKTNKFWFRNNSGILDSQIIGGIGFSGNTTATTIPGAGTFVSIGNGSSSPPHLSFAADSANERVSLQGAYPNQSIQYDGYEDKQFNTLIALSVATSGGAEKTSAVRLLLNDVPVPGSEFRFITKGAGSISYNITLELSNNDKLKLQISNIDDTASLIVYSARLTLLAA